MKRSSSHGRRTGAGAPQAASQSANAETPSMDDKTKAKQTRKTASEQISAEATTTPGATFDSANSPNTGADTATVSGAKAPLRLQDSFVDERNDVLAVINELEDQLDRHQEIREALERELSNTSEQLQTSNQRSQEMEWQVVTLQTRVDALEQLKQEVSALEEELADANVRSQRVGEQLNATEKERIRFKSELKAANKQIDGLWPLRKERDSLRSDCKALSAKIDELERYQRDVLEERTHLHAQVQEAQGTIEELRTQRQQLDTNLRTTAERVKELTQLEEILSDKVDNLRSEKKNFQAQITHLERENSRLLDQRQFYESELTSVRGQNRTAESALASVKKAFTEVRVALSDTKARARRRALDVWPRAGTSLSGLFDTAQPDTQRTTVIKDDTEEIPSLDTVGNVGTPSSITDGRDAENA